MIAVEMLCVVDTGMPSCAAITRMVADAVSAAKPLIGCSLTILCPSVLMMRQPPLAVPAAITSAQLNTIQESMSVLPPSGCMKDSHDGSESSVPAACAEKIASAITPMVFCASL